MTAARSLRRDRLIVLGTYVVAAAVAAAVVFLERGIHPIWVAALADLAATAVVFIVSLRLDNSSVYDPYWSVAPVLIAVYWWATADGGTDALRPLVVFLLVLLWAVRLTLNWLRRWRGLDDEDWRYVTLRNRHGSRYWTVSFLGIHLLPTVLVLLGCLPLYAVLAGAATGWSAIDFAACGLTSVAIGIEARADSELHRFRASRPSAAEILDTGLWARCRHPNYLGEVLFWWGLYLFGVAANPGFWWTGAGALSITLLFVFVSVPMIDERMLERRPGYEERMRSVPALLPRLLPGGTGSS